MCCSSSRFTNRDRHVGKYREAGTRRRRQEASGRYTGGRRCLHHEVFAMENGNFLTLSGELREYPDYPSSTTNPNAPLETAKVVGDVVVEFAPDGTVVNEYHLLDIIDPYRLNYSSLLGHWDWFFHDYFGVEDRRGTGPMQTPSSTTPGTIRS
ncbi:MAG: aryl-sulfate sulfotransferase [Thermodesulfobacteriota bacterium]